MHGHCFLGLHLNLQGLLGPLFHKALQAFGLVPLHLGFDPPIPLVKWDVFLLALLEQVRGGLLQHKLFVLFL